MPLVHGHIVLNHLHLGINQWQMEACECVNAWVETGLLGLAGAWAFYRFVIKRESKPYVQFDLEIRPLGVSGHMRLLELEARLTNKGSVRHYIDQFDFSLFGLQGNAPIEQGDQTINHQVKMEMLISDRQWVPLHREGDTDGWGHTFVDPGIVQAYRHVTAIPITFKYLVLRSRFSYRDRKSDFHDCQIALSM